MMAHVLLPETASMKNRRVGLWLIGAWGGVSATAVLGLAAWKRGLADGTSMVTALPLFDGLDLDGPDAFVVGGHDIRKSSFLAAVKDLHKRSNVFDSTLIDASQPQLEEWAANVRPGTILNSGAALSKMAD